MKSFLMLSEPRVVRKRVQNARFLVLAGISLFFCATVAHAQNQRVTPTPTSNSELSHQNLKRVAASASDVKSVLLSDPGLMVAMKEWVAKDLTDHGQIVSDSDLTDDAILDRVESDIPFRSVATALLQRYGYLVPKINPDSDMGKEQLLLVQERAKWMAQHEEEARLAEHSRFEEELQKAAEQDRACGGNTQTACNGQNPSQTSAPGAGQPQVPGHPIFAPPPTAQPSPSAPAQPGGEPLERAQLMQTGDDLDGIGGQAGGSRGGSVDFAGSLSGGDSGSGGSQIQRAPDGGLSASGAGGGSSRGQASGFDEASLGGFAASDPSDLAASGVGAGSTPVSPGFTAVSPKQPDYRRYQSSLLPQPVAMVRKRSPYSDIPSLYDMYMQATPRPTTPKRFGAEVFQVGSQDLQLIPMDLPVGPDYVVGPGDGLSIDIWGGVSRRLFRTVDREGRISIPEAGPVVVSGKSLGEVQQELQVVLKSQFRDESAEVSLSRLRSIRVYEVGEIVDPGAHDISSLSSPLNALFAAGGPTPQGSMRIVKHYRGTQLIQVVDLYDLLLHGVRSDMLRLENGDSIMVPPIGPQVTLEGMVRRPAIYELRDEKNLASVLELAGGLLPTAALQHIEVQRVVAHEKRTMLSLDITDTSDASEVTKRLESFQVEAGDRIRIFPIPSYNEDTVYLEGHVLRPGRYSYRDNMRVTDVVASYKDLLPEPAQQYAEIIRLNPPDFHPSVESFDLSAALANPAQAPVLHAMDTLRIFSKYDFENPPAVSVLGDVRSPGTYPTSGQIRLSDAIHLAGGLAPDAQLENVQVFRYLPDGKLKIFSVSLTNAVGGDTAANIVLEPRDRLLIHKNPELADPATVYVEGDVSRPGRYPLTTNMGVADLIRVGGGLKPSADTRNADLTHYEWANQSRITGKNETISIDAALTGDPSANLPLHNGDVLTIREVPGWSDLGASIAVRGEVKHPGTYGIRPGERLSSVLQRAGGFQSDAYPYGAILQRPSVRELQGKAQNEMILRLKGQQENLELLPVNTPDQTRAKDMALQQYQTTLNELSSNSPVGRVAIKISLDSSRWQNTPADIEVRAGDTLTIPKQPSIVLVTGQVFNPTAVAYRPGKSAKWYLSQSGGPTQLANKKAIFVIRADGSVLGESSGLFSGESLDAALRPGDTVVVPEKAISGGVQWQNIFLAAQVASSIASTVFIAVHY